MRVGLPGDLQLSDGFIVFVNPGLDVMNVTVGLTYRFDGNPLFRLH